MCFFIETDERRKNSISVFDYYNKISLKSSESFKDLKAKMEVDVKSECDHLLEKKKIKKEANWRPRKDLNVYMEYLGLFSDLYSSNIFCVTINIQPGKRRKTCNLF